MGYAFRFARTAFGICVYAASMLVAQPGMAQSDDRLQSQSAQAFRQSYGQLLDGFDQIFQQEGNAKGQEAVARARASLQAVSDADLAHAFSRSGLPDAAPAVSAMQRIAAVSERERSVQSGKKRITSVPFPNSPTVIDDCNNTPHGDQITYDALIAFQVTSGILAAAAWVCNEDILGENGSLACVPLAIANDIASSLFAVRSFCGGLDVSAAVFGSYDRLGHIHTDLTNARADIIANANSNTTALTNSINASMTSIINNANANTNTIVANDNANRNLIIGQLQALGCEIVRLLNTPDGLKASSIDACKAQPGFPYSWNKR